MIRPIELATTYTKPSGSTNPYTICDKANLNGFYISRAR